MHLVYPKVSQRAIKIIIPFSSTYLCEYGFSRLLAIKTKARNKVEVEDDLRSSPSFTAQYIIDLAANKQVQKLHQIELLIYHYKYITSKKCTEYTNVMGIDKKLIYLNSKSNIHCLAISIRTDRNFHSYFFAFICLS